MKTQRIKTRTLVALSLTLCLIASIGCPPADQQSTDSSPNQQSDDGDNQTSDSSDSDQQQDEVSVNDEGEAQTVLTDEVLFEGWPEPQAVLFVTGRQNGYIEPCGCTGLANQKGGLLRRHTLFLDLEGRGWSLIPIDLGNQVRRFGRQPVIKFERTLEALTQLMNYEGILLGPDDLAIDSIAILQTIENYKRDFNPLISANVTVLIEDLCSKYRVVEKGGIRVGITGVLEDRFEQEINNSDVTMISVDDGLNAVIPDLLGEECDVNVLLAHTSIDESERIAEQFPHFDVIVTSGGDGEPTREPKVIQTGDHTTQIVQTGYKGMHVGAVGIFDQGESVRYQRIPLDVRFDDSEDMKTIFTNYQNQLKTLGLSGLELRELPHPSGHTYVGSDVCGECHTIAFDIWENGHDGNGGPHFHATSSLTDPGERTWVTRQFDPECLSCHVTGWNPQKYYPYTDGYLDLDASSHLHGNGCENCHGPGSAHVEAEYGEVSLSNEEIRALQLELRVTEEEARANLCMECHDLDNSPDFHEEGAWDIYWPRIEHRGFD